MNNCFEFKPTDEEKNIINKYKTSSTIYEKIESNSKEILKKYILNEEVDVSKLESEWFPSDNVDVFISHSHIDEELAISLAKYLKSELDINSFVDSCLWKNVDDLLEALNDKFSRIDKNTFDHKKAKKAAENAYMILNIALQKQISKSKYFIFINTKNSIKREKINGVSITYSPWIYSELSFINLFNNRSEVKNRYSLNEGLIYKIDLNRMEKVSLADMESIFKVNHSLNSTNNNIKNNKLVLNEGE